MLDDEVPDTIDDLEEIEEEMENDDAPALFVTMPGTLVQPRKMFYPAGLLADKQDGSSGNLTTPSQQESSTHV